MKILQICTDLRLGGIQRFVLDLCQELGKKHEVILLTTWSEKTDELKMENPAFRRISLGKTKGGFSILLMLKVCRLIWKEKPDVVHTHYFTLAYSFPMIYFHLPRKTKFVHTVHNVADKECMGPYDIFRKLSYGKTTIPVAISTKVRKTLNDIFPNLDPLLILNGANITKDAENEDRHADINKMASCRTFINIGNLSHCKNQIMLNAAARKLERNGYCFKVFIFGRNDNPDYYKKMMAEKCDSVIYMGPTKNPCHHLRRNDFFTLASIYEGMPISLIEALGCGCVPVCTPAGGIPNACIHHQTGILAEDITEEALYQAMKEALEMPEAVYQKYRENCLSLYHERFTIQKCAEQYEQVYLGGIL